MSLFDRSRTLPLRLCRNQLWREWRLRMNVGSQMLSKSKTMRLRLIAIFIALMGAISVQAAPPEIGQTVPPAAAEAGKDQVHALNNAFARVFETVAPSVVIIEVSKKNDGSESSALEDLFFRGPPDENNPRRNSRGLQPIRSEGSGFIARPDGFI